MMDDDDGAPDRCDHCERYMWQRALGFLEIVLPNTECDIPRAYVFCSWGCLTQWVVTVYEEAYGASGFRPRHRRVPRSSGLG